MVAVAGRLDVDATPSGTATYFMKHETHDPSAITPDALDKYVRCYSSPGGVKCMCEIYRATLTDGGQNRESARTRLPIPVLAVGSEHFIGADNERQMREVADDERAVILPWGHQLAEEPPEELAGTTCASSPGRRHDLRGP